MDTTVEQPGGQAPPGGTIRISAEDSRELRWYFSDPQIAGVGTGGNLGAMLDRASIMAIRLIPCRKCGGDPATGQQGTGRCPRSGRQYDKELTRYRKKLAKEEGLRVVDTIAIELEWKRLGVDNVVAAETVADELPLELTKHCQRCEGTGMVERRRNNRAGPQTARPTGSSIVGNPDAMHWVDEQALARYATISRTLDEVMTVSPLARACLAEYYAPGGGSIGSIWRLTEEGKRFLRVTPNPQKVSPEALMQNEREANREKPIAERTTMLSTIARECSELWDQACRTWCEVARPRREDDAYPVRPEPPAGEQVGAGDEVS